LSCRPDTGTRPGSAVIDSPRRSPPREHIVINRPRVAAPFMGSIRQTYIKRVAIDLIRHYPDAFTGDFAHNKEKVLELTDLRVDVAGTPTVVYKKLANRIAGYATRYVKRRRAT
jgi:small subunit ribosomal protein S17e